MLVLNSDSDSEIEAVRLRDRTAMSMAEAQQSGALFEIFADCLRDAGMDFAWIYCANSNFEGEVILRAGFGPAQHRPPETLSRKFLHSAFAANQILVKKTAADSRFSQVLKARVHKGDWLAAQVPTRHDAGAPAVLVGCLERDIRESDFSFLIFAIRQLALCLDKLFLIESAADSKRTKSAFISNFSHEVRTPLNAMLGYSEILASRHLTQERRMEITQAIRRNGDRLTNLIDSTLDLSRLEGGKLGLCYKETPTVHVLNEVRSVAETLAEDKGIRFKILISGPIPAITFVDDLRVKQILLNLIENSIKFTGAGGSVTLSMGDRVADGGPPEFIFYVEDTGIGISPRDQSRLFDPFSQVEDSATRRYGGTGLGLALAMRIANELGGGVRLIRSAQGQGSVFEVAIPYSPVVGSAIIRPESFEDKILEENRDLKISLPSLAGKRILLVEDSPDNQEIFELFLAGSGAQVEVVADGLAAVERGQEAGWDLILMDVQIPEMDGKTATRHLRSLGITTPIVALTAHALEEERRECLAAGLDGQITKPVTERDLIHAVESFMKVGRNSAVEVV
ncbi:MAG: response regulator [Bdellovibrionales bacterium]